MLIQDAIRSGKRFRVSGIHSKDTDSTWYGPYNAASEAMKHPRDQISFTAWQMIQDWEVEQEKIEVTKEKLHEAIIDAACETSPYSTEFNRPLRSFNEVLFEKLGFKS